MSDYEFHKGKIKPTGQTVAEFLKDKPLPWGDFYVDFDDESTLIVWMYESFHDTHTVLKGYVWEIVEQNKDKTLYDLAEMSENPDGTCDYMLYFYNGGCSRDEAMEEAFVGMHKRFQEAVRKRKEYAENTRKAYQKYYEE